MRAVIGVAIAAIVTSTSCGARAPVQTELTPVGGDVRPEPAPSARAGTAPVTAAPRPVDRRGSTLEASDPLLARALATAAAQPSPARYRHVSDAYWRHGIFDDAHEYLVAALQLDERDAATHEALARLWRDARLPHVALGDAHRAAYYAPDWSVAHNTLGTVFQALGRRAEAVVSYERALEADPAAAYVWSNLCYGRLLLGQLLAAATACERALHLDPGLPAARSNLGLVRAADEGRRYEMAGSPTLPR
jgi:tetratricopeptide (TPR) repeat protein